MSQATKVVTSLVLAAFAGVGTARAEAIYQPPDPEPTAEETLLLEIINRMRADPAAEAKRVRADPGVHAERREIDWALFASEMAAEKAVPPLVMNPKLLLAARRHAYYLAANDKRGHVEEGELAGFTGVKMPDRVVEAGYRWMSWWENVYAAPDAWSVHAGFVVDFSKKGQGGMLEGRGHRKNLLRDNVREAGVGTFARDKDVIYCEGFADRKEALRLAGGVAYVDRDGDGFYDIGEGIGGAIVEASDGTRTTTWKSGGWALELAGTEAVTITIRHRDHKKTASFPAGRESVKLDLLEMP